MHLRDSLFVFHLDVSPGCQKHNFYETAVYTFFFDEKLDILHVLISFLQAPLWLYSVYASDQSHLLKFTNSPLSAKERDQGRMSLP